MKSGSNDLRNGLRGMKSRSICFQYGLREMKSGSNDLRNGLRKEKSRQNGIRIITFISQSDDSDFLYQLATYRVDNLICDINLQDGKLLIHFYMITLILAS